MGESETMAWALAVALSAAASSTSAQVTDAAPGRDALPGAYRVAFVGAAPTRLTGQLRGGYGLVEGAEGEGGAHHRLLGSASVAVRPHPRLAVAIGTDGRWDRHPSDAEGRDASAVGVPWLVLRGSAEVIEGLSVGGDVRWDVHGGTAPAFDPLGGRLTLRVLATARPSPHLTLGLAGGVRFDGTRRTLGSGELPYRSGDRVSLDVSDHDAAVFGVAGAYAFDRLELWSEITWEPPIGPGAPPLDRAAGRLAVGARLPVALGLVAELAAEVGFRSREPVQLDNLSEVEPRVMLLAGVSYRFDLTAPCEGRRAPTAAPRAETPSPPLETDPSPAEEPPPVGVLRGLVRDYGGRPVVGARVRVNGTVAGRVSDDGSFELTLEPGEHRVEVAADGHATQRRRVNVEQNGVTILNVDLRRAR